MNTSAAHNKRFIKQWGALIIVCLLICGCAHEPAQEFAPRQEESFKNSVIKEERGDITEAVEELKVALTIDPANKRVRDELVRLMEKRDREAEKRFKAGMALKDSDPLAAVKEFIAALRIRSDYQEAMRALKNLQLESSEASLRARIKKQATPSPNKAQADVAEEYETVSYMDAAISFYEEGDYASAIRELQKVRTRYPRDPEITRYLNLSWYNLGISSFNKKDYFKALDLFSNVKSDFERVNEYVKKCTQELKKNAENLYKDGLKFYREQKLQEAINKWNLVLKIDSGHQKAREYIEKATKLLETLKKQR